MCQSVKPKVYGAVPLSAKGRKKSLHQCTGIVGHYSFWIDTWTQYESCAISPKQGPCAFLLGENLIRNWSFLQSQKKFLFLISWTQNKRAVLLLFYQHAQKVHHLEQGERERESLAFELRFYQLSPSGIGWVCWFLYSGHRAGFWMRHFGPGSKTELVAINSGSWSIQRSPSFIGN